MGRVKAWWNGLDYSAQDWFILSGLLMLAVVGFSVGAVGATYMGALEPLMHIGFSMGTTGILVAIFGSMARLA